MITMRASCIVLLLSWPTTLCIAQEAAIEQTTTDKKLEIQPHVVELAEGKLLVQVPGNWEKVKPRSRIIVHEFKVPTAKEDTEPGRMTIMSAGGGLEANITRWVGQFKTPEGKPLGEKNKRIEEKQLGELTVHVVDLAGNFQDKPRGPFGPTVERPGYRMLAAIVPTKEDGTWFIKYYGPQKSVAEEEKNFAAMIDSFQWKGDGQSERPETSRSPADALQ